MIDIDDKIAVIFAVLVITVASMVIMGIDAKEIVMSSLTGLYGIAVGKSLQKP